jgi:Mg-chelatase subunit ChlD
MNAYNDSVMDKKGIQIRNDDSPKGISLTIGDTKVNTLGKPVSIKFGKQLSYVYLVIDCSGSMSGGKLQQVKKGVQDFAKDAFQKDYLVGLISFETQVKHICEPTSDLDVIQKGLEMIYATGTTNMADAITLAHQHLKPFDATRVMLIATDGKPDNELNAIKAGDVAKADKIDIITIGTDDADQAFLKILASSTQLASKVSKEVFSQSISASVKLLPPPKRIIKR